MSEDDSRHDTADSTERSADKPRRSWLDRISAALSGEPTSREDLIELLRDVQADGLIAADTLRMMEGAIAVSDLNSPGKNFFSILLVNGFCLLLLAGFWLALTARKTRRTLE